MKIKKTFITLTTLVALVLSTTVAFALPTITSFDDQDFQANEPSTQLLDITITDDAVTPYITAGSIKITIPSDIKILFNPSRTAENMLIYGTAVDSGKVLATPAITFENGDKTLVIPVEGDFAAGEDITITKVYVEGFHNSPGVSKNMYMTLNDDTTQYINDKTIYIQTSSLDDTHAPDIPTNIVIQDDVSGVKVTWIDPTDLDLQTVQLLRGVNPLPIDAGNPIEIAAGIQEYTDTGVTDGDTVKYILRSNDGRNLGTNTEEISFVVGTGSTATEPPVEEPPIEEPPVEEPPVEEPPVTDPPVEDPPVEAPLYCSGYTDIAVNDPHCDALTYVTEQGIFEGYPDGTFGAEQGINRAETVKVIVEGFNVTLLEDDGTDLGFSDVTIGEWYMPYLNTAKQGGIVQGYPDGTFNPEQTVNYIEMLKIFFETAAVDLVGAEGDQWYQKYLDYAVANNLVPYEDIIAGMKRVDVAELFYQWSLL